MTATTSVSEIVTKSAESTSEAVTPAVAKLCLAECLGTFVLVLFGCGVVHTAVLMGAQSGFWQVAVVWGVSIMLAIYMVSDISGAHINPAANKTGTGTLAFAAILALPETNPGTSPGSVSSSENSKRNRARRNHPCRRSE